MRVVWAEEEGLKGRMRAATAKKRKTRALTDFETLPPSNSLLSQIDESNSARFTKILQIAREQAAGASESDLRRLKRQVRGGEKFDAPETPARPPLPPRPVLTPSTRTKTTPNSLRP